MASGWQAGAAPTGVLPRRDLLGREGDVRALAERCVSSRFVSLLGPGGTGKTTLAAATAPEAADELGATALWVDLQPVPPDGDVAPVIGEVLGINVAGASAPIRKLARGLADRRVLLVLDNCEHVVGRIADVLEVLLPACGGLRVLATSREVVGVTGEQFVRLEPLAVPSDGVEVTPEVLREHAATALFLQRAALDSDDLPAEERRAVVGVCRQLDGLPLAIELAAARSPTLSPSAIEAALSDRFRLLTSRRRSPSERQRTLEASIGWSYDLLDDGEQRLLRSVAVFPAGFDLAGAAVVGADGDESAATDLLTGLVDKSLVAVQERRSGRRFRLLESVRAFARQRLAESDELAAARERHVEAIQRRLERLALSDDHEGLVLRGEPWMAEEFDDVRAAAVWATETGRPGIAVDLWWAVHVWAYAHARPAGPREGVLALDPRELDDRGRLRRDILTVVGPSTAVVGDVASGQRHIDVLWEHGTPDPDRPLTAFLARLWLTGTQAFAFDANPIGVVQTSRQLVAVAQQQPAWGDLVQVITALVAARSLELMSHHEEAFETMAARLAAAQRLGSPVLLALSHGLVATSAGIMALPSAKEHLQQALDAVPEGLGHMRIGMIASAGVVVALARGDMELLGDLSQRHRHHAGAAGTGSWVNMKLVEASLALFEGRPSDALATVEQIPDPARRRSQLDLWRADDVRIRALARLGRVDEALPAAERFHAAFVSSPVGFIAGAGTIVLMEARLATDDPHDALAAGADIAPQLAERRQRVLIVSIAALAAKALAALGRPEDAARTLGVIEEQVVDRGAALVPDMREYAEAAEASARRALGDEAYDAASAAGREMTWEEWAAWIARGRGARGDKPSHGWPALTPTELEVARRAAEGLSTAEVAEVMFVSPNTIKTHLKHIYRKLDVSSRVELAAVVDEHDGGG